MIASFDTSVNPTKTSAYQLPPVHVEMADTFARELEQEERAKQGYGPLVQHWIGEHPRAALGIAVGVGLILGIAFKRVKTW